MKPRDVGFQLANVFFWRLAYTMIAPLIAAIVGCGPNAVPPHGAGQAVSPPLPVVSGAEMHALVQLAERPVLVEFGVNFGCIRCDQMRPEMARLFREVEGRADVVRVDFNANQQLAVQLGATICPSYVLFDQGRVVVARSFPTSADLLAADLESVLAHNGGIE